MSKKWTKEELDFLKDNYKQNGAIYCSEHLDRKIYAIRKKAKQINLSYSKNRGIYEKEYLEKIIKESSTYKDVLDKMNLRSAGGNYKVLKKYINIYNISTEHFLTAKELSKKNFKKEKKPLSDVLIEKSTYNNRSLLKKRLYANNLKKPICELCGQDENWKGVRISLILDHINGIYDDNRLINLRIVCPNCNAGLNTHAGKNKNKN
jgi:hypothetical protein